MKWRTTRIVCPSKTLPTLYFREANWSPMLSAWACREKRDGVFLDGGPTYLAEEAARAWVEAFREP